jgi:hypothetical protein
MIIKDILYAQLRTEKEYLQSPKKRRACFSAGEILRLIGNKKELLKILYKRGILSQGECAVPRYRQENIRHLENIT